MNMNTADYPELAGDIERKRKQRKSRVARAAAWLARTCKKGQRRWKW